MKTTNFKTTVMAALATAFLSASALAQSSAPANTSQANANDWKKNVKLTFSMDYYGQAVTDLGSMAQPDVDKGTRDTTSPAFFEPAIIGGYKIGKWTVGAAAALDYRPSLLDDTAHSNVTWLDPQLRVTNGDLYTKGNFSLGTQLRAYMGMTDASRAAGMIANLRWYQFYGLEFPGSRWSLSMVTYIRPYIWSASVAKNRKSMEIYVGPQVNYQFNEKVRGWLLFEYTGEQINNAGFFTLRSPNDLANRGPYTDVELGASWNISPKLSLTPYIDMKTADRVALDTTTINANITYLAL